jgi:hypothetical protein
MWERAEGVPPTRCQPRTGRVTRRGITRVRIGASYSRLLRRAGQPRSRGRAWTWCVSGKHGGRTTAVLTRAGKVTTVASTAPGHRAGRVKPGVKATKKVRKGTRKFGAHVRSRKLGGGRRLAFGVHKGRVRWVAVTTARTRSGLRRQLRIAHLR